jgi:hypothetical protein
MRPDMPANTAKRFKLIGCKVMMRELYRLACQSGNVIDLLWKKQALHNTPDILRSEVQAAIDAVEAEEEKYDAILLGYCLCSNGIVGLKTANTPLVIPRGHDCVTMLLGSKERYKKLFNSYNGGIYWYSPGWIEHSPMPGRERYESQYKEYAEKYGEDNAQYLMEMEQGWFREYKCALYVDWPEQRHPEYAEYTRECADYLKWEYREESGDSALLRDFLDGNWDDERFLVVKPGETVQPSFDEKIIRT